MAPSARAVVVEDEPLARSRLTDLLAEVPWIEVVAEAGDGESGLAVIERTRPDVVFLDIQMPGLDGLDLVGRLEHRPLVVFTTAFEEHAVSAFGLRALDYLVKPFGRKRLADTLDRIADALSGSEPGPPPLHQLLIRSGRRVVPVPIDDVVRFEGRDDYVAVHTLGGRHLASIRMNELERTLDPNRFIRVHRSHIVSLDHVKEIRSAGDGRLVVELADGAAVRVSRSRAREVRARFS